MVVNFSTKGARSAAEVEKIALRAAAAGGQDVVRIEAAVGVEPPRKRMGQCPSARSVSVHV